MVDVKNAEMAIIKRAYYGMCDGHGPFLNLDGITFKDGTCFSWSIPQPDADGIIRIAGIRDVKDLAGKPCLAVNGGLGRACEFIQLLQL